MTRERLEDMKVAIACVLHGADRPTRISLKSQALARMLEDAVNEIEELKKQMQAMARCLVKENKGGTA